MITERYIHEKEGYSPFLIREGWQVAQLNYEEASRPENIKRLDVHHQTDEAFLLISGKAILVSANIENDHITYDMEEMKEGITYNIPVNVWHTIALQEGAKVLIIEKDNTHLGDFEFYDFSKSQHQLFLNEIRKIWK
ncbi:hypothetical protein MY04_4851 [Flammeovirga sp. MY04]|uniref:hypothetical protein n=1 Tax=Flammeovirga sp. MY04 TaxID=1191459 RepID=UPI0008062B2A|nr:hypothetical protein [Flammeovirga sp. MY04]ANQ52186.1 hypothetical protein MY04_4851 [Flammeovirga sp. MY04]